MQKRGQVTVFIIIGLIIIILVGVFYYVRSYNIKSESEKSIRKTKFTDTDIVKAYAETCIKMVSEEALFDRIGLQGGYINPEGDALYNDPGVPLPGPGSTSYLGDKVPFYLDGSTTYIPSLDDISRKLANYIDVEFQKCFNKNVFENIGLGIDSVADAKSEVNINKEDISINVNYKLILSNVDAETKVESFRVELPIRLKILFDNAVLLAQRIAGSQPNVYSINSDCASYDRDGLINVYVRNSDYGDGKIIQIFDYSTFYKHYLNSYIFQFAVKDANVEGSCAGS